MPPPRILLELTAILVLGIGAQWLAYRLRLPSILLLLVFGLVAGPVLGFISPDALLGDLLPPLVSLSVALILFEGGMSLRRSELPAIRKALVRLTTLGVLIAWCLITLAAWWLLAVPLATALLLGAILVVTGPTVIGPLLRHIRPEGRVGAIAKWEGIVVDPIGAVLAILVHEAAELVREASVGEALNHAVLGLGRTVLVGGGVAVVAAGPLVFLLGRYRIPDFLQSSVLLMIVAAAFTASNLIQEESGLLTVTLMGVLLVNQKEAPIRPLIEFKENLRVLLISGLFILLAARLKPADLEGLGLGSVAFVALLILVIRPVSVLLSTLGSGLSLREQLFLAWLAPRGIVAAAVASVFALRMGEEGERLTPIVFAVIIATVLVYGLTAGPIARRLGLSTPNPQGLLIAGAHPLARAIAAALRDAGVTVLLVDNNHENTRSARMQGLPTHYGSVLSERLHEQLDLGGIGRFLALTPNAEVNSLACLHFSELFGRGEVYQLLAQAKDNARTETAAALVHGRAAFGEAVDHETLARRLAQGGTIKTTRLTATFDFAAFRQQHGDDAVPLFTLEDGKLTVITADAAPSLRPGVTLISLITPRADPAS
ncbi:MAG: sodium:proton antiporter [Nannocystaceae bacterium]